VSPEAVFLFFFKKKFFLLFVGVMRCGRQGSEGTRVSREAVFATLYCGKHAPWRSFFPFFLSLFPIFFLSDVLANALLPRLGGVKRVLKYARTATLSACISCVVK
jgi:hypothetical protein